MEITQARVPEIISYASCITCWYFDRVVRGEDYDAADPLILTFLAGSTVTGTAACANVSIIDDDAVEGDHSFRVIVSGVELVPDGGYPGLTIGTANSALINIVDNDGMVT